MTLQNAGTESVMPFASLALGMLLIQRHFVFIAFDFIVFSVSKQFKVIHAAILSGSNGTIKV